MKLKLILILQLVIINACSQQKFSDIISGEWTSQMSDDGDWYPDIIVFRTDGKYFVYNDFDFIGMPGSNTEFDIITDNNGAMALTETGKWKYDPVKEQLTLLERNFIKAHSLFNEFYGKEEKLVLKVKSIENNRLVLCPLGDKNKCEVYLRNYNPRSSPEKIFYREIKEEYNGNGSQEIEIQLSALETELRIECVFLNEPYRLIVKDRSGKELLSSYITNNNGISKHAISLRGVTKLTLNVKGSQEMSKWEVRVEIK